MKSPALRLLLLGVLAAAPLPAAFESARVEPTVEPQIPARLRMDGFHDGRIRLAVDLDAEGKLNDWVVVMASHAELIAPCVDAVRQWRFIPAHYNGARVPARMEFTIEISQTGAVISRSVVDTVTDFFERVTGRPNDYEMCPAGGTDRPLVAVTRVPPRYAVEAREQGIGGRVRVHFFVDGQGNVRLPAVPPETNPYLSLVAVEAMREWKFQPPTRDGKPVLVAAVQEFDFGGGAALGGK